MLVCFYIVCAYNVYQIKLYWLSNNAKNNKKKHLMFADYNIFHLNIYKSIHLKHFYNILH